MVTIFISDGVTLQTSYSGVPCFRTSSLNFIGKQLENFAFILVAYLVAKLITSMSNLARVARKPPLA